MDDFSSFAGRCEKSKFGTSFISHTFYFALQGGNNMKGFKSRKFLISVAAMLASIGASIAGISNCNDVVTIAGMACTIIAAAIYAGCEAYVDASCS